MKEKEESSKNFKHYIDNKFFCESMMEWKSKVIKAEQSGEPRPPVTDYIGESFLKIAEHLSHRPNFINYPFREDMVGDGVENCLLYAHNFDPTKSSNPFSYFTQIIYYAFLRRIEKEKKQAYIKYKSLQMNDINGKLVDWLKSQPDYASYSDFLQKNFSLTETDIEKLEPPEKKKRKRRKKK
jgi:DNA-directed RNA polymerase specialized sigma24 family protein